MANKSVFMHAYYNCDVFWHSVVIVSGVAGPLAAQGGGQICRPFVLGF